MSPKPGTISSGGREGEREQQKSGEPGVEERRRAAVRGEAMAAGLRD